MPEAEFSWPIADGPAAAAGFRLATWIPEGVGTAVSAVLHAGLLCALAVWVIPHALERSDHLLLDTRIAGKAQPLLSVALETEEEGEALEATALPEIVAADGLTSVASPVPALPTVPQISSSTSYGAGSELHGLLSALQDDGPMVQFFGSTAYGTQFVFVLDASGSMNEGARFRRAAAELLETIDRLSIDHWFYVILFNGRARPMFDLPLVRAELVQATAENKDRLERWLARARPGGWSDPREALEKAISLRPSAIFLLSDGEFKIGPRIQRIGGTTLRAANHLNEGHVPIHTIAYEDPINRRVLRAMARASGGSYRYVPPQDR